MQRRYWLAVLLLSVLPIFLFTGIMGALNFSFPNSVSSPLVSKTSLFLTLLSNNTGLAMRWLLFEVPLVAFGATENSGPVWGIYWSVFNIIVIIVIALVFAKRYSRFPVESGHQIILRGVALLLCWLVTFEVWLAGCCTAGPQWWPEVVLLAKAYASNPYIDTINWQGLYQGLARIAVPLKIVLFATGVGVMRRQSKQQ